MSLNIKIYEDDDNFRNLLASFLDLQGYVVRAYSSPEAHPLIRSGGCPCYEEDPCAQVIISDVNMPGMSGLEFVARLRENRCRVSRTALMSGSWTPEMKRTADDLGCKIFEKPFQFREILDWLRDCATEIDVFERDRRIAQVG